jgi:plastocyanin
MKPHSKGTRLALAALAAVLACLATSLSAAPAQVIVSITRFAFGPAELTVRPGTQVTWVNHDQVPHTVTGKDDKLLASPGLDTDDRYSQTFTRTGDFAYYCTVHPFMTGVVHVRN